MRSSNTDRVWFVTGSSKGLGWEFVDAALKAGERVVATARDPKTLQPFVDQFGDQVLALELDVTNRDAVGSSIRAAIEHFGHLDVVVNNAGYGLRGTVEEVTEDQLRRIMETNFFGALAVTRAVLPQLRKQGNGHLIQISTMGGLVAFPRLGLYHASKWALEGMTESLAQEIAPFGIKVTIVEPGGFATEWMNASMDFAPTMPEYVEALGPVPPSRIRPYERPEGLKVGDPRKAGPALLEIVNTENPPLRVIWGGNAYDMVTGTYQKRLAEWAAWETMSRSTDFDE
jgi:NAD(P)-dependent dehydrogenase (short-subunit alcohol dehydrogenase family)